MEVLSREVNENNKILESLESAILDLQLSWSTVISSLVIMGDLYALFSPVVAEKGYYVIKFSDTGTGEFLTQWMLDNGGLVSKSVELTHVNVIICCLL